MSATLKKRVGWLNNQGGFQNTLLFDKIVEASGGLDDSLILKVLKELEDHRGQVTNPTAYVTAALRKAGGVGGGAQKRPMGGGQPNGNSAKRARAPQNFGGPQNFQNFGGPPQNFQNFGGQMDQKLRKRVGWLNKEGGFNNQIRHDKVTEAAAGLPEQHVMKVLKYLEEKGATIKDPTSWVTAALRKDGGGAGGFGGPGGGAPWQGMAQTANFAGAMDEKLRKRIGWLNKNGGFNNALQYDKVSEVAGGLPQDKIFGVLKNLEEKGPQVVKEPTSWVTAALRKAGGGHAPPLATMAGRPGPSLEVMEQKIKTKVGWLNTRGGFQNGIAYDKIMAASVGLKKDIVMKVLNMLDNKSKREGAQNVKDATAWVTSAFRKAKGPKGVGGSTLSAKSLGLRKRIGWLNKNGFQLRFEEIFAQSTKAAPGAALKILNTLEHHQGRIENATGWVVRALKKAPKTNMKVSRMAKGMVRKPAFTK